MKGPTMNYSTGPQITRIATGEGDSSGCRLQLVVFVEDEMVGLTMVVGSFRVVGSTEAGASRFADSTFFSYNFSLFLPSFTTIFLPVLQALLESTEVKSERRKRPV